MMLTITADDFRLLSDSCQRELLSMLRYSEVNKAEGGIDDNESIPYEDGHLILTENYTQFADAENRVVTSGAKRVIDITQEQAKELIANISNKSIETLSRFASGEPILLNELFGDGRPYANLSDLKRSFVGAVNRRLRTVTGNRQAVLFLTVKPISPDMDTQIAVRPATALSLNHALGLPVEDNNLET